MKVLFAPKSCYNTFFVCERINMKKHTTLKITYSAMCIALAIVLPFITANNQQLGNMLCLMHIPVLLCGFLCGWQYGFAVGAVSPILRSLIVGAPPMFPIAFAMAFELAAYGLVAGLLYKLLPKKPLNIYVSLVAAMVSGRIVWGAVKFIIAGLTSSSFPFSVFIASAVTNAVPGIILHIVLVPIIVMVLKRAKLVPADN